MYFYCIRLQINKHVCLSVCLRLQYENGQITVYAVLRTFAPIATAHL